MVYQFSEEGYRRGLTTLKYNKTVRRDDILAEQLNNYGPKTHKWRLNLEQDPTNMEEIKDHRHPETREGICDTQKITSCQEPGPR